MVKCLFKFCAYKIWLFVVLLMSFESSFYILDTSVFFVRYMIYKYFFYSRTCYSLNRVLPTLSRM